MGIRADVVRTSLFILAFVTLGFGFALYLFVASGKNKKDLELPKNLRVCKLIKK